MSTYREVIYMCLDSLKLSSDESYYTEEHILYLIKAYRNALLAQKYKDIKKNIPESNYQTICLNLSRVDSSNCAEETLLKSTETIPNLLELGIPIISPIKNTISSTLTLVNAERFKYVGYNKWLQSIIYATIGSDNHLYLKSSNPQFLHLEKLKLKGIFEDAVKASDLSCDLENMDCDILDRELPLEEDLLSTLIQSIVQYLSTGIYKPEDTINDGNDNLASLASFIRQNMKSNFQKQIDG